jgi:hypothetical protein
MKHKDEVLRTWADLNQHLMNVADEAECLRLLKAEKTGPRKSTTIMLRIHSRYNYLRAHRERHEIVNNA